MKILVTGGSGFLGSHIVDQLVKEKYSVVSLDLKPSSYKNDEVEEIVGDICDVDLLLSALDKVDAVFHLGAVADIGYSEKNPAKTIEVNTLATCKLLDAMVKKEVKKIYFASTIYVNSSSGSFYRISKQACESIISEYSLLNDISFTILRFGTLWGPRSGNTNAIYNYLFQAAYKNKIDVTGSGDEIREYIHVKDASEIAVNLLKEKQKCLTFILTGHHQTKLRDLIETIRELVNKDISINYLGSKSSHYLRTPYQYRDDSDIKKIVLNTYQDMGVSLLSLYSDIKKNIE